MAKRGNQGSVSTLTTRRVARAEGTGPLQVPKLQEMPPKLDVTAHESLFTNRSASVLSRK